jgi:hypothetical protein
MRFETFLAALDAAGWQGVSDAQHTIIEIMWRNMYPVIAELEDENKRLYSDIQEYLDEQPKI